jgi:2-polyprenyl-6-methoxyphenol hydroxylase-like FAD-dependent oxidoreductase
VCPLIARVLCHALMSSAVLPHRGAGATSAIEDAEALAAFLHDATPATVPAELVRAFAVRYKRATAFQTASRVQNSTAPPDPADSERVLRVYAYPGAERWAAENPGMVLPI